MDITYLKCTCNNVGPLIDSSILQFVWTFKIGLTPHQVELFVNKISSKHKLLLDGNIILKFPTNFSPLFKFEFKIQDKLAVIRRSQEDFYQFTLQLLDPEPHSQLGQPLKSEANTARDAAKKDDLRTSHSESNDSESSLMKKKTIDFEQQMVLVKKQTNNRISIFDEDEAPPPDSSSFEPLREIRTWPPPLLIESRLGDSRSEHDESSLNLRRKYPQQISSELGPLDFSMLEASFTNITISKHQQRTAEGICSAQASGTHHGSQASNLQNKAESYHDR